ncbi:hypothetical protein PsorP6_004261 [Peronosclerospora sorghi]|uniref:Uncharacterized protein n=1 Tax=Peronosclerospora sorghi TaxID=230839 RepID=A0ACC0VMX0_9STRA|nr:hypothetical protein PsorP6_004261 [Peronosclerospora sorghi]
MSMNAAQGPMDVSPAFKLISTKMRSLNEKERLAEAKPRQLAEETRALQIQLTESSSALRQTYQIYVQIKMFISTHKKNEKYRLQVGKNALKSLAKAIEHMLRGGMSVGNKALVEFEKIDSSKEIAEFIRLNRQPYAPDKQIVVSSHRNESLKEEMREYLASLDASSSMASENADKSPQSPTNRLLFSNEVVSVPEKALQRSSSLRKEDDQAANDDARAKCSSTEFVFRDECFQSIQQLCSSIKEVTEAVLSDPLTPKDTEAHNAVSKSSSNGKRKRQERFEDVAAVDPSLTLASTDAADSHTISKDSSDLISSSTTPVISEEDVILNEYDLLLDEEAPFSIETAFSSLWIESDTFARSLLNASGSINISLPPWEKKTIIYTAVNKPDTFDASRLVLFTHNKKYMVGPSVIPTTQTRRYAYKPHSRLVISTTTRVSDVPYCDYFHVEHGWVFSSTETRGRSLVQVGLRIQWSKNTWLKKQIESTTISEAKDSVKTWLNAALNATKPLTTDSDATSMDPTMSGRGQEKSSNVALTGLPATSSVQSMPASVAELPTLLYPTLHKIIIVCALVFIYTMYYVCAALGKMQVLTRESLNQQRQHNEVLKELLDHLKSKDLRNK